MIEMGFGSLNLSSSEAVITELDKYMLYNDSVKEDEIAMVGKDEKFIYSFRENLPKVLEKNILNVDNGNNIEIKVDSLPEYVKDYFNNLLLNKPCENLIFDRDFATKITVHWAKYVPVSKKNSEFLISVYPIERFAPFAVNGDRFVKEVDIAPIIEGYPKCLDVDQLINRITRTYKDKWECFYGKWDRFEKRPFYIR